MKTIILRLWHYARRNVFNTCVIAAFIWFIFFDQHSILAIHLLNRQAADMRQEIEDFKEMVERYRQDIEEVSGDEEQMEHFAREQLHMKKSNEDVFLIEE